MKVLSLFDGMSCGQIAFTELGMPIDEYYAYEIDKYAIQVTQHNFPNTIQCGDVFKADFTKHNNIDWLIGGSPCTYWSIAQKNNRETEASGLGWELFSQYIRALHEAKPKFFIYENNKSMSKEIRASIDKAFGFEAIGINSALVSAQNRQRLYWVGIRQEDGTYKKANIEQPTDIGILLKDILESGADLTQNNKSFCLTSRYNGAVAWNTIERNQKNMVAVPVTGNIPASKQICEVKNGYIIIKNKRYPVKLADGYYIIRKLYVKECARLQTVPEWYDFSCISNSQAYKCLGNGWTVEVIKHLILSARRK